jgi:hypothetical protein
MARPSRTIAAADTALKPWLASITVRELPNTARRGIVMLCPITIRQNRQGKVASGAAAVARVSTYLSATTAGAASKEAFMAVIGIYTEPTGRTRVLFDLRVSAGDDVARIADAMARSRPPEAEDEDRTVVTAAGLRAVDRVVPAFR